MAVLSRRVYYSDYQNRLVIKREMAVRTLKNSLPGLAGGEHSGSAAF
jgi:hypothetical protein